MNGKRRIVLLFVMTGALGACGAGEGEHGHAHDGGAPHAHGPETSAAPDDSEQGHAHGEDTHTHDVPDTQAFYGEEAAAAGDGHEHPHGDEVHTHDGPDAGHAEDEAGEPDQD